MLPPFLLSAWVSHPPRRRRSSAMVSTQPVAGELGFQPPFGAALRVRFGGCRVRAERRAQRAGVVARCAALAEGWCAG
ncbi:hypothetical protein V6Z11_D10G145000 [Gossypium hirsutum]